MTKTHTLDNSFFASLILLFVIGAAHSYECQGSNTPPLSLEGKRFVDSSTGRYVPIKGIAYYPRPNDGRLSQGNSVDFFTDEFSSRWLTDIANLKDLGVNAIRIYAVDPSANHDAFMCALSRAGIYVMVGLLADCEGCGIGAWVGKDAEPPLCYPSSVKERGKFVVRSFSKYPNVIAFSAGNEVSIYADDGKGGPREINVPCQKKFLRDMREYVSGCTGSYTNAVLPRAIPIGTVNWDNPQTLDQHVYYHCRTNSEDIFENTEWFALNSYRHCDGFATNADEIIGWPDLLEYFRGANFPGPVLFGEYGCREQGFPTINGFEAQRTWFQTEALYAPKYSEVFAGGFVFEYSAEKSVVDVNLQFMANYLDLDEPASEWPYEKFARVNYGVGYFSPSDCEHVDGGCEYKKYPEWDGLVEALATSEAQVIPSQTPGAIPECPPRLPALLDFDWPTDSEDDLDLEYCKQIREDSLTTAPPTDTITESPSASLTTPEPTASIATEVPTTGSEDSSPSTLEPTTGIATEVPTAGSMNTSPPTSSRNEDNGDNDTNAPVGDPTGFPTEESEDSCSNHSECSEQNLAGTCCPTIDGVYLGCCDPRPLFPWEVPTTEPAENSQESSAPMTFSISRLQTQMVPCGMLLVATLSAILNVII